ncbi:membrane progestin receptor gamma isoform X2 [Tyto alba]|nr:membrane progestin receptor gamma isoform X2 [Tyto alba]
MTNETLNIWTHFVPAWYFVWTLVGRLRGPGGQEDPHAWPLLAYLLTCCIYPLASSCAHTFSTMSTRARHICYFFDYAALSMYSLGSALAYSAYIFPAEWLDSTFHHCYVPIAVFNTVVSTGLSCYSRFLEVERPRFSKASRTLAFVYPYLFDSIPLFYRVRLPPPIFTAPTHLLAAGLEISAASSHSENIWENMPVIFFFFFFFSPPKENKLWQEKRFGYFFLYLLIGRFLHFKAPRSNFARAGKFLPLKAAGFPVPKLERGGNFAPVSSKDKKCGAGIRVKTEAPALVRSPGSCPGAGQLEMTGGWGDSGDDADSFRNVLFPSFPCVGPLRGARLCCCSSTCARRRAARRRRSWSTTSTPPSPSSLASSSPATCQRDLRQDTLITSGTATKFSTSAGSSARTSRWKPSRWTWPSAAGGSCPPRCCPPPCRPSGPWASARP